MIFSYLIEGVPSWKLVLEGRKTQTRRANNYYQVGQVLAVQPGRGQKGVGFIEITREWHQTEAELTDGEAIKEGFIPHNVLLPGVDANLCQVVGATPRERFIELWGQMYPWAPYPYGWWAYEFKLVRNAVEVKPPGTWDSLGVDGVEEEDDD